MPVAPIGSITFRDKAKAVSTTAANFSDAAAVSFVTDQTGAIATWIAAVAALSKATVIGSRGGIEDAAANPVLPTADDAYNSSKLTVFYHDSTTGKKQRFSIPARDISKFNTYPASKNVILTIALGGTAEIEALVTATNAGVLSEDGNAVVVDQIVISGGRQGG